MSSNFSTVERVTHDIRSGIEEGRYSPGQRLVENDLSKSLSVSRGPIREAMRLLAAEGIVNFERNRGAAIRKLTRREVADIYQVRVVNEGLAARLAAENASIPDNRRQLDRMYKEVLSLSEDLDYQRHPKHNQRFHRLLVELGANEELVDLISRLQLPILYLQFRSAVDLAAIKTSLGHHQKIITAVMDGDATRAEKLMRRHVSVAQDAILSIPDSFFGAAPD